MGGFEPSTFRSESENTNHYVMQAAHNKRVVYDKKCNTFWCDSVNLLWSLEAWNTQRKYRKTINKNQVPPRFQLGSLDSESRVLTVTPWNRRICLFSCPHLKSRLDSVLWFDSSWRDLMAVFHIDNPNTLSSAIIMETWRRLAKPNMEKDNHREVFENYLLLAGNESCKTIFYHHWNMQPHAVYLLQLISTLNYTDTGKRNHEITMF